MVAELLVTNPAEATTTVTSVAASLPPPGQDIPLDIFNFAILAIGYISVALPAARVVLRERDEQLTAGIRQACRLAVQQQQQNGSKKSSTPKVVAVLGLLHVNGVAQRILSSSAATPPPQAETMRRYLSEKGIAPRITSREILGDRTLAQGDGTFSS
jgi:hypothetical protein